VAKLIDDIRLTEATLVRVLNFISQNSAM